MVVTFWSTKQPEIKPNGIGFDIEIHLDSEGLSDLFNQLDPADVVSYAGKTALLDEIGSEAVEMHFNLVPKEDFEIMEKRAEIAEGTLQEPIQNIPIEDGKNYIDFEQ